MQFVILNEKNVSQVALYLGLTLQQEMDILLKPMMEQEYPCIELDTWKKRVENLRAWQEAH